VTLQGAPTSWGPQIGKDGLSERHSPLETAEGGYISTASTKKESDLAQGTHKLGTVERGSCQDQGRQTA